MELKECLPELFCIREDFVYKVYENTIERFFQTEDFDGIPINVVTPVTQLSPFHVVMVKTPHQKLNHTFIRKWNGRHSRSCFWKYAGPYLKTKKGNRVPIVHFIDDDVDDCVLPFNSSVHYASSIPVLNESDTKQRRLPLKGP
jgi:hypothetical protein